MPRPPIPQEEIDRIKRLWIEKGKPSGEKLLADDQFEIGQKAGQQRHGVRKYQQWIAEAKLEYEEIPPDPELKPWGDGWPQNDPDAIECLYRLRLKALRHPVRLTTRVGKWALRLRKLFKGGPGTDSDFHLLYWADAYAMRERACESLKVPMHTGDLDGPLMYRLWESPSLARVTEYRDAIATGLIPSWNVGTYLQDLTNSEGLQGVGTSVRSLASCMEYLLTAKPNGDGLSLEEAREPMRKASDNASMLHEFVSRRTKSMHVIEKEMEAITDSYEAAAAAAEGDANREAKNQDLAWWINIMPVLMEWIRTGNSPFQQGGSDKEENDHARTN